MKRPHARHHLALALLILPGDGQLSTRNSRGTFWSFGEAEAREQHGATTYCSRNHISHRDAATGAATPFGLEPLAATSSNFHHKRRLDLQAEVEIKNADDKKIER